MKSTHRYTRATRNAKEFRIVDAQTTSRPQVAILGGINGAGKTSSADPVLRIGLGMPAFVNADTIARGLNALDPESEAIRAGRIMLEHLRELIARRCSFAFETTLAGRTYADWLAELSQVGYAIHLFYFWLNSTDLAIERVAFRVRTGGHHIPTNTIRRRYASSVRNFLELYRPRVTTWQVYDNSNDRPRLIAFNNGSFETILDSETWEQFNRSADDSRAPTLPATESIDHARIDSALETAFRELLLEHARMGRSVSESRDGKIVTISPTEIFACYGLDEHGKPKSTPNQNVHEVA